MCQYHFLHKLEFVSIKEKGENIHLNFYFALVLTSSSIKAMKSSTLTVICSL